VRSDQALTVGDILLRRTRLGLLAGSALLAGQAPERIAAAAGAELGWDAATQAAEVQRFRAEAAAEGIAPAS
jgi:glycerol-3-phosphate dehydrogenase